MSHFSQVHGAVGLWQSVFGTVAGFRRVGWPFEWLGLAAVGFGPGVICLNPAIQQLSQHFFTGFQTDRRRQGQGKIDIEPRLLISWSGFSHVNPNGRSGLTPSKTTHKIKRLKDSSSRYPDIQSTPAMTF
jgi:hypothetical protein